MTQFIAITSHNFRLSPDIKGENAFLRSAEPPHGACSAGSWCGPGMAQAPPVAERLGPTAWPPPAPAPPGRRQPRSHKKLTFASQTHTPGREPASLSVPAVIGRGPLVICRSPGCRMSLFQSHIELGLCHLFLTLSSS